MDRLVTKSKTAMNSEEDIADLARLQDEWETTLQSIDICSKADTHLAENITTIDNYSTGDALQFMVSTNGMVVHGKNRGVGWRSRQVGGHLSDISLQQLSRDFTTVSIRTTTNDSPHSGDNTPPVPNDGGANAPNPGFGERYGRGFKLSPKSVPDVTRSSTWSSEGAHNGSRQC